MAENTDQVDICIVGGAGHVGLPLGLIFADHGLSVCLCDRNAQALENIEAGRMPFLESGGQEILARTLKQGRLSFSTDPSAVKNAGTIIITIGTPVDEFYNPSFKAIKAWF
jgi:UDP-N-acetyl-D-mannosaminuronic acid dehydrogenase